MRKLLFLLPLLPSLLFADVSAEKLAEIRQQALEQAVIFHEGKNPSTSQLLQTAREFEDYLLNQSPVSKAATLKQEPIEEEMSPTINASNYKGSDKAKKASHFKGLSLGINIQAKTTTVKVDGDINSKHYVLDAVGDNYLLGDINLEYGFQLTEKALLSFGATYSVNSFDLLNISAKRDYFRAEGEDTYSIYVAPGFALSENVLGYAKLSYNHFELNTKSNTTSANDSLSVHGYGIGLGFKSQISESLHASVEIQRIMNTDDSFVSQGLGTGSTVGVVGLSYNFNESPVIFDSKATNFQGFNVGLTGELKSTLTKFSIEQYPLDSAGNQHSASSIYVSYTAPLAHRIFLMTGATYSLTDNELSKISDSVGNWETFEESEHYSVFLAPAYQLSNNSLGFIKLAYHKAQIDTHGKYGIGNYKEEYSEDLDGYGIGVGLRSEIYKNIFADIEVQHINYHSNKTSISTRRTKSLGSDTNTTIGNVGISYKF